MSLIWTFSPSSLDEVERCIVAAQPPDETNKWILRFGRRNYLKDNITSTDLNQDKCTVNKVPSLENPRCDDKEENYNAEQFEELLESIQSEPVGKFELLVAESLKNPKLLIYLANKLSTNSAEKIMNHIYENKELDAKFVEEFHKHFLPCLLHKEHSWFTLDMIVKSYKIYPKAFEILLKIVIKDIEISNKVLQDLVENFNEKELSEIMLIIMDLELSTAEFSHHLFNIYMAYKSCRKTTDIQNWILKQISQHANACVSEKNYGKLLFTFLQAEKELQLLKNYGSIEKILEIHRSPFKRPCLNLLQELLKKNNNMDTTGVYSEVI